MQHEVKDWNQPKAKLVFWTIGFLWAVVLFWGLSHHLPRTLGQSALYTGISGIENLVRPVTMGWILIIGTVMFAIHAMVMRVWTSWMQRHALAKLSQYYLDVEDKEAETKGRHKRLWRYYLEKNFLGPITEEWLARWVPLFFFQPWVSVCLVILGGALWMAGHYDQVKPRTFRVRMSILSTSAFIYLMPMVVVYYATRNPLAALAASSLPHILHNLLLDIAPSYQPWLRKQAA